MIHVERGAVPDGFAAHTAEWRRECEDKQQKNPEYSPSTFWTLVRKRKAMKQYTEILFNAFRNKCAFCESKVKHVSPEHIEHYRPKEKDKFPELMFNWENWLLSCPTCNTNKGTKFPYCDDGEPCFLEPTVDEPGEHLDFLRAQILSRTNRGEKTVQEIGLNRESLTANRARWLMTVDLLLLLACCVSEAHTGARKLLIWAMQPEAPYTAMTRAYLQRNAPKLAASNTTYPFVEEHRQLERIAELVAQYHEQLQQLI